MLFCGQWQECVAFYRDGLGLDTAFDNDWFVQFVLNSASRLSVADASRAGVESAHGKGMTVTVKVEVIFAAYGTIMGRGFSSGRAEKHAWGADVFYLTDPDGNRIEFRAD